MKKSEIIKKLKIEYNGNIYDKITDLSIYDNQVHFSNMDSDSIRTNVNTEINKVKIIHEVKEK